MSFAKALALLSLLGVTFFSTRAFSSSHFSIHKNDLGAPLYRNLYELNLNITSDRFRSVQVEFIGKSGTLISEKLTKRFKLSDYQGCPGRCSFLIETLPLQLEAFTCELKLKTETFTGATKEWGLPWGACRQSPPRPNERLLSDLEIGEENASPTSLVITNLGAQLIDKRIRLMVFLIDKKGRAIWSKQENFELSLSQNESFEFVSDNNLKDWHHALGCRFYAVIDSEFSIHERLKLNNQLQLEFGECQDTPDSSLGDLFDFAPSLSFEEGLLHVSVSNLGRLPLLNSHERLEYDVLFRNAQGEIVYRIQNTMSAPLHGFGDSKNVLATPILNNACRISVSLNKNILLKESNYLNNSSEISFCGAVGANL